MEDQIHSSLISSTHIFQTKSHNNPLKQTDKYWTSKGRFRYIFFGHEYLIVTGVTIKKTNDTMSESLIDQHIGYRHRIFILGSSFIKISKINAHSNFLRILFLNGHNIRYPFSIMTRPNKSSIK